MRTGSIVVIILFLFLSVGCKENSTSSNNGNGDNVTGTLLGKVQVIDYRNRAMADASGVLVQCDGTSYSGVSDSAGNWALKDLPTRTYTLTFSKPGFYTWKHTSYAFVAGGITRYRSASGANYVQIGEYPRYTVTLDGITMPTEKISGSILAHTSNNTPAASYVNVIVLLSKNPNLTIDDPSSYSGSILINSISTPLAVDTSVNITSSTYYQTFSGLSFVPGQTVYFRLYPYAGREYYDAVSDKNIPVGYTSSNCSNVLSGVMQ